MDVNLDAAPDYIFARGDRLYIYDGSAPAVALWNSDVIGSGVGVNDSVMAGDFDADGKLEVMVNIGQTGFQVYEITPPCAGILVGAASRKSNVAAVGGACDIPIDLTPGGTITTDPRQEANDRGISQIILSYNGAPCTSTSVILEEDASCPSPPDYVPYTGTSSMGCVGHESYIQCTFTPALENARTYRLTVPDGPGGGFTYVEIHGLVGDVDSSGYVNAVDRALVVGAWTSPAGFTCNTDFGNDGRTDAVDRAIVVGAWTGVGTNCAP